MKILKIYHMIWDGKKQKGREHELPWSTRYEKFHAVFLVAKLRALKYKDLFITESEIDVIIQPDRVLFSLLQLYFQIKGFFA